MGLAAWLLGPLFCEEILCWILASGEMVCPPLYSDLVCGDTFFLPSLSTSRSSVNVLLVGVERAF